MIVLGRPLGIELAIYLSGLGKKVGIMEMANSLNYSGNVIHSMAINNEIKRLGIEIILSTKAAAINAEGVVGEFVGDSFSPAPVCDTIAKGMLVSVISEAKLETNAEIGSRRLYEADTGIYALGQIPRRGNQFFTQLRTHVL